MRLRPLSKIGDEALSGENLDVRGWEVRTDLDDEKVGSVEDMLVDDGGSPRYLEVKRGRLGGKHVLLPLSQARADGDRDIVWVPGVTHDRFESIPEWDGNTNMLDDAYGSRLTAAYRGEDVVEEHDAIERDQGGARLRELEDMDGFRIPSNEPNPRGWDVITADGRRVGEVDGLLVDTEAMKVRYLDCDLDSKKLGFDADRERHVLIPLSHARLDDEEKRVLVEGLTADGLQHLPIYAGLPLGRDFERQVRDSFTDTGSTRGGDRFLAERGRADREAGDFTAREDARTSKRMVGEGPGTDAGTMEAQRLASDARRAAGASERSAQRAEHASERASERTEGETSTRSSGDQELRIRVRGDEITVEKRPLE